MKTKILVTNSLSETILFANNYAKKLNPGDVICLEGDLGTGKTTIAKAICKYFGVNSEVISPTFNILKEYNVDKFSIKRIFHFDLYRIKDLNDLYNIGFEDYLYDDNAITLIEWPNIASELITKSCKHIHISYLNNNRREIFYD